MSLHSNSLPRPRTGACPRVSERAPGCACVRSLVRLRVASSGSCVCALLSVVRSVGTLSPSYPRFARLVRRSLRSRVRVRPGGCVSLARVRVGVRGGLLSLVLNRTCLLAFSRLLASLFGYTLLLSLSLRTL